MEHEFSIKTRFTAGKSTDQSRDEIWKAMASFRLGCVSKRGYSRQRFVLDNGYAEFAGGFVPRNQNFHWFAPTRIDQELPLVFGIII